MTHAEIVRTLYVLVPGTEWSLSGEDIEGMVWRSAGAAPTRAAIEAAWIEVQAIPPPVRTPMEKLAALIGETPAVLETAIAAARTRP